MARPRVHDRAKIMAEVCQRIALGHLVQDVAKKLGVHPATVSEWAAEEPFAEPYARARELQAHAIAGDALRIADNKKGDPQRDRLRVDTRKWLASKIAPRYYGERKEVAMTTPDGPLRIEVVRESKKRTK